MDSSSYVASLSFSDFNPSSAATMSASSVLSRCWRVAWYWHATYKRACNYIYFKDKCWKRRVTMYTYGIESTQQSFGRLEPMITQNTVSKNSLTIYFTFENDLRSIFSFLIDVPPPHTLSSSSILLPVLSTSLFACPRKHASHLFTSGKYFQQP